MNTKSIHLVVGGWVAANGVLAGVLAAWLPEPISVVLYSASIAVLSAFGIALLIAVRHDRVGQQPRMPVRGTTAALITIGLALAGLGLIYGYYLSLLALYPLVLAALRVHRERLKPGVRPWPAAPDGAAPAGAPRADYQGIAVGVAEPVPATHPAHGPPAPPQPRRIGAVRAAGLAVIAARVIRQLLRRRHR